MTIAATVTRPDAKPNDPPYLHATGELNPSDMIATLWLSESGFEP
jgi:hypothetical protein